jgi:hypothetical protein
MPSRTQSVFLAFFRKNFFQIGHPLSELAKAMKAMESMCIFEEISGKERNRAYIFKQYLAMLSR